MQKTSTIKYLFSRSFINLVEQRRFFNQKRLRIPVLVIGCISILIWQYFSFFNPKKSILDKQYKITASTGIVKEIKFVYFYYYLGLFPVTTKQKLRTHLDYSKEGAKRIIAKHGKSLTTELTTTIIAGEPLKMFLYLPSAFLKSIAFSKGVPYQLEVRITNVFVFIIALIVLFVSFWYVRQSILGILTVLIMGSNPYQLYEVYGRENVFGYAISITLIILALHLPLITNRKRSPYYLWIVPILTGAILATARQIRSEPVPIIISAIISYLLISRTHWSVKSGLVVLLILSFSTISYGWNSYFEHKFEEAVQCVKKAGGQVPYDNLVNGHAVWHPIWCGLGDFDKKYGYVWSDRSAKNYAYPILIKKYGKEIFFRDKANKKRKSSIPECEVHLIPQYTEVIRNKILQDIIHDPLWYLDIILQRVMRVITEIPPARISFGQHWITLPMHGLLIFPMMVLLFYTRSWMLAKLVCFTLPLCFTAIFIYSGGGTTFYSSYHMFMAAICGAWLVEGGLHWYKNL